VIEIEERSGFERVPGREEDTDRIGNADAGC
jgi:hypothetical protein